MIAWAATPVGHFTVHMLTAATLGAIGWGLWWYANRGVDTEEQVAAIDADLTAVEEDQDALWDRVEEIVTWLWALAGLPKPEGEPTEEHAAVVDDEPEPVDDAPDLPPTDAMPTVEAHAAIDMGLRNLSTLHRGQHRTEAGGRTVPEILAELAAATRQATISVSGRSGEAGGPTQAKGEQ